MKYLNIYPVDSFFTLNSLDSNPLNFNENDFLKHTNKLFWSQLFSEDSLKQLLDFLNDVIADSYCDVPKYIAILENPGLFFEKCRESVETLFTINVEPRKFFAASETLQIVCNLYSDLMYNPFKLYLNGGFLLPEYSSSILINSCLNEEKNPYLRFILENIYPLAKKYRPDLVFLQGGIRVSNLTLAMLLKKDNPELHISVTSHQSEYYSLNKLTDYLFKNEALFKVIDSIILDDFYYTEKALISCLSEESTPENVPNLLYRNEKNMVRQTPYVKRKQHLDEIIETEQFHPEVFGLKMWRNNKCYWSSCTFCSINKKYNCITETQFDEDTEERISAVKKMAQKGVRYILMNDEAIPPKSLFNFASALIENGINVFWECRTKIDADFTPEIVQTLHKSGLRRIMIGLESANPRIQQLMNKFPIGFDQGLIEKVAGYFSNAGIIMHYCTIIGFPSETAEEIQQTLDKLEKLKNGYKNFVFNVNIFNLDIGSRLFEKASEYDIEAVFPCEPEECLSTSLVYEYKGELMDRSQLEEIKNSFTRKNLFPWVPETSFTDLEIIDYCSTMNMLTWFCNHNELPSYPQREINPGMVLLLSKDAVIYKKPVEERGQYYLVYSWSTHYQWDIDQNMYFLLIEFNEAVRVEDAFENFAREYVPPHITSEQVRSKLLPLVNEAVFRGFLEVV